MEGRQDVIDLFLSHSHVERVEVRARRTGRMFESPTAPYFGGIDVVPDSDIPKDTIRLVDPEGKVVKTLIWNAEAESWYVIDNAALSKIAVKVEGTP